MTREQDKKVLEEVSTIVKQTFDNMNNKKKAVNVRTLDEQFTIQTGIDVSKKERGINLKPVVGMGVTRSIGSDSYPFTILDIRNVKEKTILVIRRDRDLYNYNPECSIEYAEQYKEEDGNLSYRTILWNNKTNRWNKDRYDYYYYSVGKRNYYLDPHK